MSATYFPIEQVKEAYEAASDAARAVFNDEETTKILVELDRELHLDDAQAATLGREAGYVIVGLTDQNDFTDRLKAAGFSPDMVNAILFEVMKKIFLPLSKKLNGEFKKNRALPNVLPQEIEEKKEPKSTPSTQPLKPNPVSISVPRYMSAPPLQSPLYVRNEAKVPQLDGAVLPQKMTMPRAAVTLGVNDIEPLVTISRAPAAAPQPQSPAAKPPVAQAQPPAPQKPAPRTPFPTIPTIAPIADLPLGEEDVPGVKPVLSPLPKPMQTPAARTDVPKPIQIPPAPPLSAVPPVVTQAWASPPSASAQQNPPVPVPVAAKEPQARPAVTEKGYAADPYREPIDEKN
jgi:hypothetical protein